MHLGRDQEDVIEAFCRACCLSRILVLARFALHDLVCVLQGLLKKFADPNYGDRFGPSRQKGTAKSRKAELYS